MAIKDQRELSHCETLPSNIVPSSLNSSMDVAYHKNQKRNKKKTTGRPSVFKPGKIGFQM